MKTIKERLIEMIVERCWKGYKPVPGKKPYSKGSCKSVNEGLGNVPNDEGKRAARDIKLGKVAGDLKRRGFKGRKGAGSLAQRIARRVRKIKAKENPKDSKAVDRRVFGNMRRSSEDNPELKGTRLTPSAARVGSDGKPFKKPKQKGRRVFRKGGEGTGEIETVKKIETVKEARTPAWQRSEGQNPKGGLNAKGRASAKAQGHNLKPPVSAKQAKKSKKSAARRRAFCARMSGHKRKNTSRRTANNPNSRVNLALRKWDC
jgi:hypothetical protein